ncbi:hypothetical protein BANRA_00552 [Acinetobacter baumannii]|nr:hypothetical protein BANRA_00552 [Acinetobacter baumannii]
MKLMQMKCRQTTSLKILKIEVDLDGLYMSIFKQIEIVIEHDAISDFLDTHSMRKKKYY